MPASRRRRGPGGTKRFGRWRGGGSWGSLLPILTRHKVPWLAGPTIDRNGASPIGEGRLSRDGNKGGLCGPRGGADGRFVGRGDPYEPSTPAVGVRGGDARRGYRNCGGRAGED